MGSIRRAPTKKSPATSYWVSSKGERLPDALLIVVDASNLDNHLRFALQLIDLGLPTVVALNMIDLAKRDGLELDVAKLQASSACRWSRRWRCASAGSSGSLCDPCPISSRIRAKSGRASGPSHDPLAAAAPRPRHRGRRDPARNSGAAAHSQARRGAASSDARPAYPGRDPVRHVPGGVRLVGAAGRRARSAHDVAWPMDRRGLARRRCCAR